MDFNDTPHEAEFRKEVSSWLAAHAPEHVLRPGEFLDDAMEAARGWAWQRRVHQGGYAGIALPSELGGRGLSTIEALIFAEEEDAYRLPKGPYIGIGLGMAVPVIAKHGTAEQRSKFIESTLKGDIFWCQLFSEPAAGSDLAALRTKAVRDGDDWVVNGQKIWSSWAHHSDWGILVARTDPDLPKHKGLSFFLVDMRTPGIDVRPIKQISGASDFNETFLTDVRIPDANRIGEVGDGWACCMTVLLAERLGSDSHKISMESVVASIATSGSPFETAATSIALAEALAQEQGEKLLEARFRTMLSRGEDPGARTAMIKLAYADRLQRMSGLAMELGGIEAIALSPENGLMRQIHSDYIWSAAMRIAGGADEVLRNQIAERVLGMPGDYRADRHVPFNTLK